MQKVIEDRVNNTQVPISNDQLPALTKEMADKCKNAIKALDNDKRYKYMVQALVGQNTGYGIRQGTRQFWDSTKDDLASVTVVKEGFFVTVTCFAVYLY
jgi:hypothetical protein